MVITDPDVLEQLRSIAISYGTATVVVTLHEMAKKSAATDYANNPDAVIHRDIATLERAVTELKLNHPFRMIHITRVRRPSRSR